jgi:serine/threonine-protein kinase HipA
MIEVKLWGETLGILKYDTKKRESRFAFNPAFDQKKLNVAPILMPYDPEHNGEHGIFSEAKDPFYEGLPPMTADSLPDDFGNDVLKNWLRQNNKDVNNLSPKLKLSYVGKRGLGALEYHPQLTKDNSSPIEINLRELSEISNKITETNLLPKEITRSTMKEMFMVGTSAGGARPKAVVSMNFNTKQILYSNIHMEGFRPIIIKFDKPVEETGESTEIGKIEYIYHKMAEMAEITMSPCGLFKENGLQHFYTHRFDRDDKGEKLHMQTLAGLAGMNPRHSHDYNEVFRILIALNLPYSDFEQQFRRMVFNYVTSNDDCHTKNISFLMDSKGEWRLSPAYDMTFPYQVNKVWKKPHPISINAKTKNVSLDDMYSVGKEFGIKNPQRIVDQILKVSSHWNQLAHRYKLDEAKAVEIYKYFIKQ